MNLKKKTNMELCIALFVKNIVLLVYMQFAFINVCLIRFHIKHTEQIQKQDHVSDHVHYEYPGKTAVKHIQSSVPRHNRYELNLKHRDVCRLHESDFESRERFNVRVKFRLTICIRVRYFFHHKYFCICGPRADKK